MFEISVICTEPDAPEITKALNTAFTTGVVRQQPTRDGRRVRLYITADHRPENGGWSVPEVAYATAPSIVSEIGWVAQQAANRPFGTRMGREFWLRKAALLDRIALADAAGKDPSDVDEAATEAALRLMDLDDTEAICEPRHYVRQEYARWRADQ